MSDAVPRFVSRRLPLGLFCLGLVACGGGKPEPPRPSPVGDPGGEVRPTPLPGPTNAAMAERIRSGVVTTALSAIGTPYEWGGTSRNGFDCSGLIQYAYAKYGVELPRVSLQQIESGDPVALDPDLFLPGDILGFSLDEPGKPSHVGLYVGEGEFIHSSSSGVRVSEIANPYWVAHLVAARRIVGG